MGGLLMKTILTIALLLTLCVPAFAQTQHTHRLLIVIPASRQTAMQNWWGNNIDASDTTGSTWTVGLSATGSAPATHYWACVALTPAQIKLIIQRLCNLSGITIPSGLASYTKAQIVQWITDNLVAIRIATGVRILRDDNDGIWSDYVLQAEVAGVRPVQQ
jgi:hypothetical protein